MRGRAPPAAFALTSGVPGLSFADLSAALSSDLLSLGTAAISTILSSVSVMFGGSQGKLNIPSWSLLVERWSAEISMKQFERGI
jgi:hypothetical protein